LKAQVRLRWPQLNIQISIDLLNDLNPFLTNSLLGLLPLLSIQSHAVVAGQQIYFPTRLMLPKGEAASTEPMNEQPDGRVNFEPFFQYLSINYGPVSEPVPAWAIGQVVESDIEKLASLGRVVWDNLMSDDDPFIVAVERAADDPVAIDLGLLRQVHRAPALALDDLQWQTVLDHIRQQTDSIWLIEPEDVRALRMGLQTSDAGVYGQYFSPWVMVTGLVRSLAIAELSTLLKQCDNPAFSAEHLRTMLADMLQITVGVTAFFGLPQLGNTLEAVSVTCQQIDSKDDFKGFLRALMTYVNRYNLWLHQTFPWRLGTLFPKESKDQIDE
jgi:hypothetical protein